LLVTLAAEYGREATAAEGTQVVLSQMKEMGISEMEFLMVDGSGLSRNNLLTPAAISMLLRFMASHAYFNYFFESLPVSGIDGTLKNRMKKTNAESKVHAKTGFVGHVRNLSGYLYSADNECFLFSLLVNNYTVPTPLINAFQDKLCILLSNFSR
jgi:D-alanyl-D-alanine carboxypeptidase/D-alanyl-D-alanine-endopeptidase (penicillin-binding protein 4)